MGRPIYSRPVVTVRVACEEPPAPVVEPAQPTYENWSYWNAFDPDSDEWFEGDDAVYEAFITDPSQVIPTPVIPTSPTIGEEDGVVVVGVRADALRAGSPLSSGSSEASEDSEGERSGGLRLLGESGSDSEESDDELEGSVVVVNPRPRIQGTSIDEGGRVYTVDEFIMRDEGLFAPSASTPTSSGTATSSATRVVEEIPISVPLQVEEFEVPRTPPRISRAAVPVNANTPPRTITTPIVFASPSPPPTVTPRLYTWASGSRVLPPPPMSPTPNRGPLPNRNARMSVAHIHPAIVNRVQG